MTFPYRSPLLSKFEPSGQQDVPLSGFGWADQCACFDGVRRLIAVSGKWCLGLGGSKELESLDGSPELCQGLQISLARRNLLTSILISRSRDLGGSNGTHGQWKWEETEVRRCKGRRHNSYKNQDCSQLSPVSSLPLLPQFLYISFTS